MNLKELVSKKLNDIKDAALQKKEAINEFSLLTTTSKHLSDMLPYEAKNLDPSIGREQIILSTCLTINVENSKLVNKLIPIEESIVNVKMAEEAKTKYKYIFVITNLRLWILNEKEYKCYDFDSITKCEIVNKSLLTQGINFNDDAFILEGNEADINKFIDTLTNFTVRDEQIKKATAYLCGVTPKKQMLNIHLAGITLGEKMGQIVLHNGKKGNKLIDVGDIEYIQFLMDNAVILTRGKTSQAQVSAEVPCRKMSIKFVLKSNEAYLIDIMPESIMNNIIKKEDVSYRNNVEFGRNLISLVERLMNK